MDHKPKRTVNKITVNVPNKVYENFKLKSYEDGYSMQMALKTLIDHYSDDKLVLKS